MCFNNLKELVLKAPKKNIALIKTKVYEIKNISFPNLKKLNLINVSANFAKKKF